MIHGPGHSSDECKVFGEFGTSYAAPQPTNSHGSNPIPRKGFQKNQENLNIIDNMVDELHMVESKNIGAVNHEVLQLLESDYDKNDLYQV